VTNLKKKKVAGCGSVSAPKAAGYMDWQAIVVSLLCDI
jgi:hypothetical protein